MRANAASAALRCSNQREVVRTAADGSYSLPRPAYGIVFVSLPDGYATVGAFWRSVSPSSNSPADFALTARASSGTFTFIHASDTHVSAQTARPAAAAAGDR